MNTPSNIFEVHGFFEILVARHGPAVRTLGTRAIPDPAPRPLGVDGLRSYVLTAPLTVQRGHKTVTLKASPAKPIVCEGHAHALCGRALP